MNDRTRDVVESWDTRPVSGGYRGLGELADGGFSGVVTARETWLFMLNGRGVGVYGGSLDAFEDAEATAHLAPDPSLPLLFAMQEEGGEVEAKYYTNDTPLSEASKTLTEGNFTGFVELSENVLSGDYYVVYYGGRSMSCAFVGESERLLTGDEAFQRANDEVGIYEVVKVDVDVIDIPTPDEPEGEDREAADRSTAPPDGDGAGAGQRAAETGGGPQGAAAGQQSAADEGDGDAAEAAAPDGSSDPAAADAAGTAGPGADDATVTDLDDAAAVGGAADDAVYSDEAEWQEARTIPSLNPERSGGSAGDSVVDAATPEPGGRAGTAADEADASGVDAAGESPASDAGTGPGPAPGGDDGGPASDRVAELRSALEQRETEMAKVRQQLTALQDERDEVVRERDELREEVGRLEDEVERLRSELQQARAEAGEHADAERALPPDEALAGTNFFVRYGTKGGGTLEKAHAGQVDREEVNTNLRLEHHTRFDESEVAVDGRPFEAFLEGTMESAFVSWVVRDLLYEIRDTSYDGRLRDVFDAIPMIDRAELRGAVSVEYEEDGEQYRDEVTFDVVLRDRMGNPLVVANLNDSREPTTVEMMETLVEDATRVKETHETLAGAMFVTASFFQPGALEAADEAATSGLLSRDKRASFVTRATTGGYHLCLVENRGDDFHVNVPDM